MLEGLLYLHDQGVIHRDIKGSNILATKEGSVKLADFGVATRVVTSANSDDKLENASEATGVVIDRSVVGSPYWMAPEVIEQSGATTASDIWSLGCTIIELLQGHPPYHHLDPMPALFRIVNDDCPPLPDQASSVVRDFLMQCFQKDPNLRVSARQLLKHPWMMSARKQLDRIHQSAQASSRRLNTSNGDSNRRSTAAVPYEETVAQVREWNKALDQSQTTTNSRLRAPHPPSNARRTSNEILHKLYSSSITPLPIGASVYPVISNVGLKSQLKNFPEVSSSTENKENEDNWDDDFVGDAPLFAVRGAMTTQSSSSHSNESDKSRTLRPLQSRLPKVRAGNLTSIGGNGDGATAPLQSPDHRRSNSTSSEKFPNVQLQTRRGSSTIRVPRLLEKPAHSPQPARPVPNSESGSGPIYVSGGQPESDVELYDNDYSDSFSTNKLDAQWHRRKLKLRRSPTNNVCSAQN